MGHLNVLYDNADYDEQIGFDMPARTHNNNVRLM